MSLKLNVLIINSEVLYMNFKNKNNVEVDSIGIDFYMIRNRKNSLVKNIWCKEMAENKEGCNYYPEYDLSKNVIYSYSQYYINNIYR